MKTEIIPPEPPKKPELKQGDLITLNTNEYIYIVINRESGRKALDHTFAQAEDRIYLCNLSSESGLIGYIHKDAAYHKLEQLEPLKLKIVS